MLALVFRKQVYLQILCKIISKLFTLFLLFIKHIYFSMNTFVYVYSLAYILYLYEHLLRIYVYIYVYIMKHVFLQVYPCTNIWNTFFCLNISIFKFTLIFDLLPAYFHASVYLVLRMCRKQCRQMQTCHCVSNNFHRHLYWSIHVNLYATWHIKSYLFAYLHNQQWRQR